MRITLLSYAILTGSSQRAEAQTEPKTPSPSAQRPNTSPLPPSVEERLRKIELAAGLSCPHPFEGIEGLRAFKSVPRPAPKSPEARLEHMLMNSLPRLFDNELRNPLGRIVPPSPLIYGEPSNIVKALRDFNESMRKLDGHDLEAKFYPSLDRARFDLDRAGRTQKGEALRRSIEEAVDSLIVDVAYDAPAVVTPLTSETAYVNSKLPRVFVHEIIKEYDAYLMKACNLTDTVSGPYAPRDAADTLALIQKARDLFHQAPQVNQEFHRRVITQLDGLAAHWKRHLEDPNYNLRVPLIELCKAPIYKAEVDSFFKALPKPPRPTTLPQDRTPRATP